MSEKNLGFLIIILIVLYLLSVLSKMKKILLALFFLCFCSSAIYAQPLTKDESTRKLLSLLGAKNYIDQMIQLSITNVEDDQARLKVAEILSELKKVQFDELLVPIYQKYLTEKDIEGLNTFFGSPTGKKMIKIELLVLQESENLDVEGEQANKNREKIYREQMTVTDQKNLNAFYKSAVAQKYLKVEPFISNESGLIGEEIFKKFIKNYQGDGIK